MFELSDYWIIDDIKERIYDTEKKESFIKLKE